MSTPAAFQSLKAQYGSTLHHFITASRTFDLCASIPPSTTPSSSPVPSRLYVLDSSFNPPTLAHRRIACSALRECRDSSRPVRLLLLLATQNADKPAKPASFEDRLAMMDLFAHDLRAHLATLLREDDGHKEATEESALPVIDIGVTKLPYFIDKAAAIDAAGVYPSALEQVHLTGYDTLIRILDPKYYPPTHTLQPLVPFLTHHRLRVTMRPDSEWGSRRDQEEFLRRLAQGGRESEGGRREWAQRIQLVEGRQPGDPPVSSTLARQACLSHPEDLDKLVPGPVRQFLLTQHPYSSN